MRATTVAIASHQRRASLLRLLGSLADAIASDRADAVDVVVVLDGSTDGSAEAVAALAFPVPLRVVAKPRGGLASARNAGLAAATGDLVLFLDDDLVVPPGLLRRHAGAHADGAGVVFGPCLVPDDWPVAPVIREFWRGRYAELAAAPRVTRFDRFSAANTSGPVACFRAVGGFDERFVGYGLEDYELAYRLLARGIPIRYDAAAVAWHLPERRPADLWRNRFEEGRNLVRFVRLHPETVDAVAPAPAPARRYRLLRCIPGRSPRTRHLVATAARVAARVAAATGIRTAGAARMAEAAAFTAGVAALDDRGDLLARALGAPERTGSPCGR